MKSILAYLLPLLLFFVSCRKKEMPPDEAGDPVFYAKCEINGLPVSLVAGNADYYMYSSFFRDTAEGLYVYRADLKKKNCQGDCGYMLSVLINDHKGTGIAQPVDPDSGLKVGSYLYSDKNVSPELYVTRLSPAAPSANGSYTWTIHDGNSQSTISGSSAELTLKAGKSYTVSLAYDDYVGCFTQHTNVIVPGNPLQATVSAVRNPQQPLEYKFSAQMPTPGAYVYQWNFGDGSSSTEAAPVHVYAGLNGGYYTATLTVVNPANGQSSVSFYQVPATSGNVCLANFNVACEAVPNIRSFSRVTMLLTEPSGKVYSTKDFLQPDGSTFYIHEVQTYNTNENGYPTRKLKVSFNCVLKSDGADIRITNGEAVIAVAYPN